MAIRYGYPKGREGVALTDAERERITRCIDEHGGVCREVMCDDSLDTLIGKIIAARLDAQRQALADLITRHEAHDGRVPACQLRAVLGMPARDRGDR